MSDTLGLLGFPVRTRLCGRLVTAMFAAAAFGAPASAQRASLFTSAPGAQLDSIYRDRCDAVARRG